MVNLGGHNMSNDNTILPVIGISNERGEELHKLSMDIVLEYTNVKGIDMGGMMKYVVRITPSLSDGELLFVSYTIGRMVQAIIESTESTESPSWIQSLGRT